MHANAWLRLRDMLFGDVLGAAGQRHLSGEVCHHTFASRSCRDNMFPYFSHPTAIHSHWDIGPSKAPPVWKVRMVSCVPGSPMLCAAMVPLGCPIAASLPGVERSSPQRWIMVVHPEEDRLLCDLSQGLAV